MSSAAFVTRLAAASAMESMLDCQWLVTLSRGLTLCLPPVTQHSPVIMEGQKRRAMRTPRTDLLPKLRREWQRVNC